MKKAVFLMVLLPLALIFSLNVQAEEQQPADNGQAETDRLRQALPEEAREILGKLSTDGEELGQGGLDALYEKLKKSYPDVLGNALRSGGKMIALLLLGALISAALEPGGARDAANLCCAAAVAVVAVCDAKTFFGLGQQTLYSLSDYSRALLPTMCAAAAASGAISSASVKFAATALFMDVLLSAGIKLVLPIIGLYLACVVSSAVLGKSVLDGIARFLKWTAVTLMTLLMTGFTAYLGFAGLVAGKTDEMATRVTKSAIGALLPVVGGIVSDAAGTVVAGAGIIRNTVGIFGILAVAALCLSPFLTLGVNYLVYKGTAALSAAMADKRMTALVDGIGTALGLVLALVGSGCIMLFISLVSSMRAVTGT